MMGKNKGGRRRIEGGGEGEGDEWWWWGGWVKLKVVLGDIMGWVGGRGGVCG